MVARCATAWFSGLLLAALHRAAAAGPVPAPPATLLEEAARSQSLEPGRFAALLANSMGRYPS